jgi:hypothetical protein
MSPSPRYIDFFPNPTALKRRLRSNDDETAAIFYALIQSCSDGRARRHFFRIVPNLQSSNASEPIIQLVHKRSIYVSMA